MDWDLLRSQNVEKHCSEKREEIEKRSEGTLNEQRSHLVEAINAERLRELMKANKGRKEKENHKWDGENVNDCLKCLRIENC